MTAPDDQPRRRGRPPSGGREAILEATLELLRTRGISNLTSREIAAHAGVSDASVYYHFGDRAGLLQAVFEHGMQPLQFMTGLEPEAMSRRQVLSGAARSLEQFFDEVLPVLHAAQADPELGSALGAYIEHHDLGPHKGVDALGGYLQSEQTAGRIDREIDVEVVSLLLIDAVFARATRHQMHMPDDLRLPSLERIVEQIDRLLG